MPFRPDTAYRQRDNPAAPELRVLAAQLQALFQPPCSCRESPATPLMHSHNRQMSVLFRLNIRNTLL